MIKTHALEEPTKKISDGGKPSNSKRSMDLASNGDQMNKP